MDRNMDRGHISLQMGLNTLGIGRMINRMGRGYSILLIMIDMRVNLGMVRGMGREYTIMGVVTSNKSQNS